MLKLSNEQYVLLYNWILREEERENRKWQEYLNEHPEVKERFE